MNSTDANSVDHSDSDVSVFTPSSSPGVSDDVVVASISNNGDDVVGSSSTSSRVQDSRTIVTPDSATGINENSNWSLLGGSFQLRDGLWSDVFVGEDLGVSLLLVMAAASSGGVWVLRLKLKVVGFEIFESVG